MTSRHDRTKLFLQQHIEEPKKFFTAPIMITADAAVLDTANGRIMLESAINLISRFVDKLAIRIPNSCPDIESNMKKLIVATGCEIEDNDGIEPRIVLSVGPTNVKSEFTVQINSSGWVSYVSCNSDVETFLTYNENPIGAMGAACFGAAEVFKRLLDIDGCNMAWMTTHPDQICFSFLDYTLSSNNSDFPKKINIRNALLVGAGAVGNGFLYALSKVKNLQGDIAVLDHDIIDSTNLNRCLSYFVDDVGKPKSSVCNKLSRDGLKISGHVARYDDFQKQDSAFPIIVSAVDNNAARFAIQYDLPKLIFHAATDEKISTVSVIKLLENACFCCLFEDTPTYEMIISNETGIPIDIVTKAIKQKSLFSEEHYSYMCRKFSNTVTQFQNLIGKPFEDVYQKEICGLFPVQTDDGIETPSVPFVSFFAGLCVASELIKYHSKIFKKVPMMNDLDYLQISLFIPEHLNLAHRQKNSSCSLNCSDVSRQKLFREKWGNPT